MLHLRLDNRTYMLAICFVVIPLSLLVGMGIEYIRAAGLGSGC